MSQASSLRWSTTVTVIGITALAMLRSAVAENGEDRVLELSFAEDAPALAISISGIYASDTLTCPEIIIDGVPGQFRDAEIAEGDHRLPVEGLCLLSLVNMDHERGLLVRFSPSIQNVALLNDALWTTAGAQLAPASQRRFSMILSELKPITIPFNIQYQGSNTLPAALNLSLVSAE